MAIIKCFTTPRASNFDYNILEPLQKLLRLSSPIAHSLARPDLFFGISDKLNHRKPVVRLNLLRILRSICEASKGVDTIRGHRLFETIQKLAEKDTAVLVKTMAGELVKSNLDKDEDSGSSVARAGISRRMSSYSPPEIRHNSSIPNTPTRTTRTSHASALNDSVTMPTSRRPIAPMSSTDSLAFRPRNCDSNRDLHREGIRDGGRDPSRDESIDRVSVPAMRRTSAEAGRGSRLPRTTMHRASRSSLAAPAIGATSEHSSMRRESGVRLRDHSRSSVATTSTANTSGGSGTSAAPPHLNSRRRTRMPSDGDNHLS